MLRNFFRSLWTPQPLPSSVAYITVSSESLKEQSEPLPQSCFYVLLESDCYQQRFFTFDPIPLWKRWWCIFLGRFHALTFKRSDTCTRSWWMHQNSLGASSLYHRSIEYSRSWMRSRAAEFKKAPFFMGFYPFEHIIIDALMRDQGFSSSTTYLIIRIQSSGIYEEWLNHSGALVRHKRFPLPEHTRNTLHNKDAREPFMREKMAQTLAELPLLGWPEPQHIMILWPFESRIPLDRSPVFFLNADRAIAQALGHYHPHPRLSLGCSSLAWWKLWCLPLRRATCVLLLGACALACGSGYKIIHLRTEREHLEQSLAAKKKKMLQDSQPFLIRYGLWHDDWDTLIQTVQTVSHAIDERCHIAQHHDTISEILEAIESDHLFSSQGPITIQVMPTYVMLTSQGCTDDHDAWLGQLQEHFKGLKITRPDQPLDPIFSKTFDLLQPLPQSLETIEVIIPLTPL